ncbi:Alpha/beta hydrolase family protein [Carnobacterium iners]|uniref:Alpha/beta hydrolase family protein n=1 Tax=Carnobacterium iners TaxID=1073423 RepID=A0A1X7NLN3_9LACT|nr:alpha/beta hydrolase [Carnobacterium iners]SEK71389.1 Alpha/beta hydrolase family protein [Carnobacterium iners]SMH38423.1 Alpha/beta hydrolase family protein [Carnobacterium iners]
MKNKKKIAVWLTLTLLLLVTIGFVTLKNLTYQPSSLALEAATNTSSYTVETTNNVVYFKPTKKPLNSSLIFYQGALVNQKSYSIWASKLASEGYPVYLVHHPFNLAITNKNKAKDIVEEYAIKDYIIGGHSLGGVMASRYAHDKQKDPTIDKGSLKGIFFLASYPDSNGSLKNTDLSVLSVTGSNDGVLNQESYLESKKFLPDDTLYSSIEGGNHAGFGSYGPQKGDSSATITNKEQQRILYSTLFSWLKTFGN